ncbi:MAG: hypothetical protein ABSH48_03910 [Verrucomicrobiota bacterium]
MNEAKAHPTAGLTYFIAIYRLQAYRPVATPPSLLSFRFGPGEQGGR